MLYFAYGLNIDSQVFLKRCPLAKNLGKYKLNNYKLCFVGVSVIHNNKGVLTVTPHENSFVEGIVWDLPLIDKLRLDKLEGYPEYYTTLKLKSPIGEVYTYTSVNRSLNKPDDSYYNDILYYYELYGFNTKHISDAYINSL
jgi:hypothetical protein